MNIWSQRKKPLFPWWSGGRKRTPGEFICSPSPLGFDQSHRQVSSSPQDSQKQEIASLKERLAATEAEKQKLAEELQKYHQHRPQFPEERGHTLQMALARLGQWGILNRDLYDFFDQATQLIRTTLGVDYCGLWELLPNRSALLLCAGDGWKQSLVGNHTIDATHRSYAGYTIHYNGDRQPDGYEPVIVEDLRLTQKFRASPLLHNLGVVSGVNVMVARPR